ncbi:MAG: ATP-dependent helicase [Pauljensenia sp.]
MTPTDPEALLDQLDPDQRRVAQQVTGPLAVLAGAGTGKTRAITYRIAHAAATGAVDPSTVLAVTFTSRAAAEMRERLRSLGVPHAQARTFHAAALRQLSFFWPGVVGGHLPSLVEHKASLVASAANRTGIRADRTTVRDLASEVEWAKVSMIDAAHYAERVRAERRDPPAGLDSAAFARLMSAYEDAKQDRGVIDFEDVLLLMCGVLEQREDVARKVRAQYRNFVVDEYQDVSTLQQHLLDLWVGERRDICVVGDVAQTIYSFAGASPRHLVEFARKHPGANVVELNRDYRSTPQVVAVANQVMGRARSTRAGRGAPGAGASAGSGNGGALEGAVHLVSQRPMGPGVAFRTYPDDTAEAAGVAARVKELVDEGVPIHSIAVLYRTNSQSETLEAAFSEAGIAFLVRGGARFFDRDEIRRAMLLLRRQAIAFAHGTPGGAAVGGEGGAPSRFGAGASDGDGTGPSGPAASGAATPGSGESDGGAAESDPSGEASSREGTGLQDQVEEVVTVVGWTPHPPTGTGAVRERWDNLNALVELARERSALTMPEFVGELEERSVAQAAPAVAGVTFSTLHAAKGLEWDAVFIIGVSEGLLPISMAQTPEAREEERRLLYVGVTRARDHLELSWSRARGAGRGRGSRTRSRFLDGIWPEETASARPSRSGAGPTGSSPRHRSRAQAQEFEEENPPEVLELFARLKEWRGRAARAISKPAFTVLADQTLRDIAIARPKTLRQLGVIRGIGAVKLDRYGAPVLAIVRGEDVEVSVEEA